MAMLNSWKSTHEDPSSVAGLNHITFEALIVHLYTGLNAFYANSDFSQYSLTRYEGYFLWSEAMHSSKFKGFEFD